MAVTVEHHLDLIVFRFSGQLSIEDIREVSAWCDETDQATPGLPRLADVTAITGTSISLGDVVRVTGERRRLSRPKVVRFAILVDSDSAHRIAQLCQTLLDHPLVDIVVFRDRRAAFAYLRVDDPEAG
jgi:hypothetical protein